MAYGTKNNPLKYIEIGNYLVDFNEGDIMLLDNVKDLLPFFPLKPATCVLVVCNKGWQKILSDGREITFGEGNILLCPAKVHTTVFHHSDDFECRVLGITEDIMQQLLRDKVDMWHHNSYLTSMNLIPMTDLMREDLSLYLSLIRSKLKHAAANAPYDILLSLLRALLLEMHFMLEASDKTVEHHQKLSQGKMLFNRFLSLISASKVKRQPITYYAGQLAITPKYLTMLCLKFSNKTASQWVAQYTVEEIRFYLKSTELSIKEISALMGFSNMSHFGSYVRKHLGQSPSEYRYGKGR